MSPLRAGKSKKVISKNIGEMMHSPSFGKGKGSKKRKDMAVAAAFEKARSERSKRKTGGK